MTSHPALSKALPIEPVPRKSSKSLGIFTEMAISVEDILDAWRTLGYPSAEKLRQHLVNEGHTISLKDARSVTRAQPVKQVFSKSPWTKKNAGQIAALKLNDRWVGDLVQETGRPVQGYSWILVVQDIFSRKLYARPLRSKQPADVVAGLRSIFQEAGDEPKSFDTDRGREFYGPVQTLLRQRGIDHFMSHPLQRNAHATLDRAIASLRQTMSRMQIEDREGDDWVAVLDRAVDAYNRTSHAALGPASPDDVGGSELLQRVMERENAQKSHQNALKAQKIRADFENAGHFRLPAHPAQRQRGHQVRWGPAQAVALGSRLGKVEDLWNKGGPHPSGPPGDSAGP
jgi:hypothetical protein